MSRPSGRPAVARVLLAILALGAWTAFLLTPSMQARGVAFTSLWDLRSVEAARLSLGRLAGALALVAAAFVPIGAAAVFVFADRASRAARALLVGVPAVLLGSLVASGAVWLRLGEAGPPGPSDLLLPAAGVFLGVVAGLAVRRGLFSLLFLPLRLALGTAILAAAALFLLFLSLEREARVEAPPAVTTEEKRAVVAAFRGRNPRRIAPGATSTLRLAQEEADDLVAWGLPLLVNPERLRGTVRFGAGDALTLRASARLPLVRRWWNLEAGGRVRVDSGRLSLREPRLRLGGLAVPALAMDAMAPLLRVGLQAERALRPLFGALRETRIEEGAASATYGRVDLAPGLVASLVWGDEEGAGMKEAVAEQVRGILAALAAAPAGDARLARAYEDAFRRARVRSPGTRAADENRAAILGLGVVLGHSRLSAFVGDVAGEAERKRAAELRRGATAHGRADWTRHFSLSGALTVLSAVRPSDAAGLLKEELDADGGSGFSFGDLLADRAGARFAALATRDEETARAVQERVSAAFRLEDYFPPGAGLPEGIRDEELRSRYGGVDGPAYREVADEIERRVAAAPGYLR
jgi:hypothetical protein